MTRMQSHGASVPLAMPTSPNQAFANHPHSEPAVGMLGSGRLESTELVGFDRRPIVLKHSLRLRVPADRLRRKFLAPTSRRP
jgi:hypothetical protein